MIFIYNTNFSWGKVYSVAQRNKDLCFWTLSTTFQKLFKEEKRELQLLLHSLFFWKILHVRLEKKKVENLLFSAKMLWKPNSNFSAATLLLLHSRSENMSLETMSQFDKIFSLVATRIAMHLFGRKFCN